MRIPRVKVEFISNPVSDRFTPEEAKKAILRSRILPIPATIVSLEVEEEKE